MRRAVGVVLGAVAFGVIAGGTMVGMNVVAEKLGIVSQQIEQQYTTEQELITEAAPSETEAETSAAANATQVQAVPAVSDVVADAMPSVVAITNMVKYQQNGYSMWGMYTEPQEYEVPASGSGVIVGKTDTELLIVTNNHVVEDSSSLSVSFVDNEAVEAFIKGTDANEDLAVIAVKLEDIPTETMNAIEVAELGDSEALQVGEQVVAIGNALGYGQSVTTGIISAKDRSIQTEEGETSGLLQTDAAINPGNSGGALLNMRGEVIGINVAKYASTNVEGMGYAIPSARAQSIIENLSSLRTREDVPETERGYLGVQVKNIDAQTAANFGMPQGVFIHKVTEGGAAEQSELQERDIITALDGQGLRTFDELRHLLSFYRAGETVTLTVQRANGSQYEELQIPVTLTADPEAAETAPEAGEAQPDEGSEGAQDFWNQFEEFFRQYQGN